MRRPSASRSVALLAIHWQTMGRWSDYHNAIPDKGDMMMTYRRTFVLILAFGLLSAGYLPSRSRAADLSEPKSAAMAFATALMSDDVAGMHAAAVGSDEQWQVIEV